MQNPVFDPYDSRQTAYALGELDEENSADLEMQLLTSPRLCHELGELQFVVAALQDRFAGESSLEIEHRAGRQHSFGSTSAGQSPSERSRRRLKRLFIVLASSGIMLALCLVSFQHKVSLPASDRPLAARGKLFDFCFNGEVDKFLPESGGRADLYRGAKDSFVAKHPFVEQAPSEFAPSTVLNDSESMIASFGWLSELDETGRICSELSGTGNQCVIPPYLCRASALWGNARPSNHVELLCEDLPMPGILFRPRCTTNNVDGHLEFHLSTRGILLSDAMSPACGLVTEYGALLEDPAFLAIVNSVSLPRRACPRGPCPHASRARSILTGENIARPKAIAEEWP